MGVFTDQEIWKDHAPSDFVFIGYNEHGEEVCRMYPADEEDYFECMSDIQSLFDQWECVLRESVSE